MKGYTEYTVMRGGTLTLNMSACLVGGCAGESTGSCAVNSSEKFPTSSSSLM